MAVTLGTCEAVVDLTLLYQHVGRSQVLCILDVCAREFGANLKLEQSRPAHEVSAILLQLAQRQSPKGTTY